MYIYIYILKVVKGGNINYVYILAKHVALTSGNIVLSATISTWSLSSSRFSLYKFLIYLTIFSSAIPSSFN